MWTNLIFWRIVTLILVVCVVGLSVFSNLGIKKIKEHYNKSLDKSQDEIDEREEKEEEDIGKLGLNIRVLVDMILILSSWARTKDPRYKREFEAMRDELPKKVSELIRMDLQ